MVLELLGTSTASVIGVVGILAAIVSVIVEVLKGILPKSFPTKLLVLIVSLIVTLAAIIVFCEVSFKIICAGIVGSFVVSFISMYGWDSLKSIYDRFNKGGGED